MLPDVVISFLAYSVIEYAMVMGLVDNAIRIFLYKPNMSQASKLWLLALEVVVIGALALGCLVVFRHPPLVSSLMIWSCLTSTKHLWQGLLRRYWNDFVEFELSRPPAPAPAPIMTTAGQTDKDNRYMRNGMVDDNRQQQAQTQHTLAQQHHLQMQQQQQQLQQAQQSQPYQRSTPAQAFHFTGKLTKTFQSAMSTLRKVRKSPPGLTNTAKTNLCAVNVTLQLLANTPALADLLVQDHLRVKKSANIQEFMTELSNVLVCLRRCTSSTVSTQPLMGITSTLGPPQPQNDCVEWLMWFMEVIHSSYMPPAPSEVESGLQRYKLLRAVPLAQPLLILYETSQLPAALSRMKIECLEKIEQAHGLKSTSYAEPIQRLTEVEWLAHKLSNHSAVDDLFTGQVVEANHCKDCHHISVSVQPFKVLPLPIITPKYTDHCISLTDCLAKFAEVERLYGANGLHCKYCNNMQNPVQNYSQTKPQVFKRATLDSGVGGDSPLYGRPSTTDMSTDFLSPIRPLREDNHHMDHSLFLDIQGKTSTPVTNQRGHWASSVASSASPVLARPRASSSPLQTSRHLSDGERQTLLSQLPDNFTVQLQRLTCNKDGKMTKVKTPVSFPLTNLDCSLLVTEMLLGGDHKSSINGCYKYSLSAVVVHLGEDSVTRGHYMIYTQTESGSWFCCNDGKVTAVNMDYEIQTRQVRENAYLLCYRKLKLI